MRRIYIYVSLPFTLLRTVQANGGLDATDAVLRNAFVSAEIALLQPPNDQNHLDGVHRVVRLRHRVTLVRYNHFACAVLSIGHRGGKWVVEGGWGR